MVRAILGGHKTQTRRIVNMDKLRVQLPRPVRGDGPWDHLEVLPGAYRAKMNPHGAVTICSTGQGFDFGVKPGEFDLVCPYADGSTHLGDYGNGRKAWTITARGRLWVRETWQAWQCVSHERDEWDPITREVRMGESWAEWVELRGRPNGIEYRADGKSVGPWTPSIHMPRWASRITLEVTGVRIERLHDISEEDAKAEGAAYRISDGGDLAGAFSHVDTTINYRAHFADLWRSINGAASWDANPWVWAISFHRVLK
jgi:hypothetical protein